MEMCYDGALVMPKNFVVIDEEDMTYVEGGYSVTISRKTINSALGYIGTAMTVYAIGKAIASGASKLLTAAISGGPLAGLAGLAFGLGVSAIIAASAVIATIYVTNSSFRLNF